MVWSCTMFFASIELYVCHCWHLTEWLMINSLGTGCFVIHMLYIGKQKVFWDAFSSLRVKSGISRKFELLSYSLFSFFQEENCILECGNNWNWRPRGYNGYPGCWIRHLGFQARCLDSFWAVSQGSQAGFPAVDRLQRSVFHMLGWTNTFHPLRRLIKCSR